MPRLSVLDQSPIPSGSTAAQALGNSVDLARAAERLGYHRYWVAEHHGTEGLAGSAPEVLIGHLLSATDTLRVGSGGVMLSHYAPLKVAETFKVLEALHPGRVDLGVGRAPGSDQRTAAALARGGRMLAVEYYPNQLQDLVWLLDDALPGDSPLVGIKATPTVAGSPQVWVLASSVDSASYAAHFGLPLAWAHFIAQGDGGPIVAAYREQYRPSARWPEPQVLVAAAVICADTDDEAEALASSVRMWRSRGLGGTIPSPAEVEAWRSTALRRLALDVGRVAPIVGGVDRATAEVVAMADRYGADEMMVVTIVWDHQARVRSYELLAERLIPG